MRRTAAPKLAKMPSAKVVPMKCGPDCTGLQCHPTMAAAPPSNLRKQSNSSCSSSSVATPSIHSNGSLCNNLNSLNTTQSSLIASNLVYDPATAQCSGGNCTNNCSNCSAAKPANLPVCTKACCSRNTHLVPLPNQKQSARQTATAASNAFQTNGGNSSCACCSPAASNPPAIRTGLKLQTSKCTDQCYLSNSNKPSSTGGQCCNVNNKPNGQTPASPLNPIVGGQAKLTAMLSGSISSHAISNQTHYDHRSNQSAQACQTLDNDRVHGGEFSEIYFSLLPSSFSQLTKHALQIILFLLFCALFVYFLFVCATYPLAKYRWHRMKCC